MAVKDITGFTGMGRTHTPRSGRAATTTGADTRAPAAAVEKVREARMAADLNMVDGVFVGGGGSLRSVDCGGVGGEVEDDAVGDYFRDDLTQRRDRVFFLPSPPR